MIEIAKAFAQGAHRAVDQRRKVTLEPYEVHLNHVVSILEEEGWHEEAIITAAYLHDVVEDTLVTVGDICEIFGGYISVLVEDLTDNTKEMFPRASRAYRKRIRRDQMKYIRTDAKLIKMADMISNLSDIEIQETSFARLYLKEKKEDLICFAALSDISLYERLENLIEEKIKLIG